MLTGLQHLEEVELVVGQPCILLGFGLTLPTPQSAVVACFAHEVTELGPLAAIEQSGKQVVALLEEDAGAIQVDIGVALALHGAGQPPLSARRQPPEGYRWEEGRGGKE